MIVRTLGFALGCAALAACSGGSGSVSSPLRLPGAGVALFSGDTQTRLIYSSSFGNNAVDYYLKGSGPNNPVAGSLSGSLSNPEGMAVDSHGNLYVANSNDRNVLVYSVGSSEPSRTLNDPNKFPADIAIGSDGTVYVANGSGPIGGSGNVVIYPPGSSNSSQTLSDSHFLHVSGVALDKHGNIYVSCNGLGQNTGTVVKFKPGSTIGTDTHITLEGAGGVGFDRYGHLLVIDETVPSLNVYDVGNPKPIHQLSLPGTSIYFSFNRDASVLYLADYSLGEIDVFKYTPSALTQTNTITNGMSASSENLGIATTPAQRL